MLRLLIIISLVFSIVIPGCKKDIPEAQKVQKEAAPKIEPAPPAAVQEPAPEATETFVYDPKGRVDPFVPLVEAKKQTGKKALIATLENYDSSDFKLIAIADKKNKRFGLLLTPDGKSFTVNEGTVLGLNKGKVIEISNDKLIILEYIGGLKPRKVILELSKWEGE